MATKKLLMPTDGNRNPVNVMTLNDSHDVDGTSVSAQSNVIDGWLVRITAIDANIRFLIGADPTALDTSHFLSTGESIWMPIQPGQKVAIKGGKANIATAGV